ncbi:uncharacterized protein BDV14DRAFT_171637 [Aspergillus stella-maris]|uniref:uncharacterized protein n=1 Tax=Aspergillus stella-maris TaxID=1810926 RepID=UPI003CCD3082
MMQLATTPWYPPSFSSNNVFKSTDVDSITTSRPIHCSVFVSSRISRITQTSKPTNVKTSLSGYLAARDMAPENRESAYPTVGQHRFRRPTFALSDR